MNDRTCVSLFSGIGGMDLGLSRAGFRHLAFCEGGGDPNGTKAERQQWKTGVYRRSVLAARWPGVPVYDDVGTFARRDGLRGVGGSDAPVEGWQRPAQAVDLLCGGFPCQDLSVAGQRRGLDGDRSGLFFEYARIAESLRPRWLLVENVPGLLSSNGGRDFGTVLGTLADIGYGVAWRVLDSRFFGVPQRRRRVFIVGALASGDPRAAAERAGQVLAVGSRCQGHPATRGETWADVAVASARGTRHGGEQWGPGVEGWLGNGEDGMEVGAGGGLASLSGLGAGSPDDNTQDPISDENVSMPLGRKTFGMGVANTVRSHTRPGSNTDASIIQGVNVRRLMPVECERLQSLPDGWTDLGGTADSKRYAALGDAVTATVSEWISRRLANA